MRRSLFALVLISSGLGLMTASWVHFGVPWGMQTQAALTNEVIGRVERRPHNHALKAHDGLFANESIHLAPEAWVRLQANGGAITLRAGASLWVDHQHQLHLAEGLATIFASAENPKEKMRFFLPQAEIEVQNGEVSLLTSTELITSLWVRQGNIHVVDPQGKVHQFEKGQAAILYPDRETEIFSSLPSFEVGFQASPKTTNETFRLSGNASWPAVVYMPVGIRFTDQRNQFSTHLPWSYRGSNFLAEDVGGRVRTMKPITPSSKKYDLP